MRAIRLLSLFAWSLLLSGCGGEPAATQASTASPETHGPALQVWPLPSGPGAAQPDLRLAPDGRLLLGWLESVEGRRTRLQFADFSADGRWGPVRTIAIGSSFFVNWADTPHLLPTADGALWVQWLQKTGTGPYAYAVALSRSADGGMTWASPVTVHEDRSQTEHGFAAMWPQGRDRIGIVWLDGRGTAGDAEGHDSGHGAASTTAMMQLRSTVFDAGLQPAPETAVDETVCDCCQTDVAISARGPVLVYRDRTAAEIRDVAVARFEDGAWAKPVPVHVDGWKMPACPVNGPAVAVDGQRVAVAWYTEGDGRPEVRLALSRDAGASFGRPVTVDAGELVHGRMDVALDAGQAWVLWLREDAGGQSLWLARHAPDLSRELGRTELARLEGRGRGTGFARLALREGAAWVVWTDIAQGTTRLHGARYRPD